MVALCCPRNNHSGVERLLRAYGRVDVVLRGSARVVHSRRTKHDSIFTTAFDVTRIHREAPLECTARARGGTTQSAIYPHLLHRSEPSQAPSQPRCSTATAGVGPGGFRRAQHATALRINLRSLRAGDQLSAKVGTARGRHELRQSRF